jgi:2C-methyl-D-erythritol 2,4-cyclodiphosphate synthase
MKNTNDTSKMWTIKKADDIRQLAVITEDLENKGWHIETVSVDELTILASKPKVERIDG